MRGDKIGINIIPHTARSTALQYKKAGDLMNVEVDILAKNMERILLFNKTRGITSSILKMWGY
jgi:riboflavin synthase